MAADIKPWPLSGPMTQQRPMPIVRPCDYGLEIAVMALETQVGTIEAYNRIVDKCRVLREQIERGHIKAQNQLYAKSIKG